MEPFTWQVYSDFADRQLQKHFGCNSIEHLLQQFWNIIFPILQYCESIKAISVNQGERWKPYQRPKRPPPRQRC